MLAAAFLLCSCAPAGTEKEDNTEEREAGVLFALPMECLHFRIPLRMGDGKMVFLGNRPDRAWFMVV